MEDIILIGFGGHARSVADCIERQKRYRIAGYTEKEKKETRYSYLGTDDMLPELYYSGIHYAFVCVGYLGKGNIRNELYARLKNIGFKLPIIIDPSAIVSDTAQIGEGTFIGKDAVINAEAKIRKMAIINTKVLIEHECMVGDFSHIAVGAVLCGQVTVGRETLVGANATVIQGVNVPAHAIVAAGETIRRNYRVINYNSSNVLIGGGDNHKVRDIVEDAAA